VNVLEARIGFLIKDYGSYRAAAKAIGVDHVYLHRVHRGKKEPSADLLNKLSLRRIVTYKLKETP